MHVVSIPKVLKLVKCPVPGCPAVVHSAERLQGKFMNRNFRSQVEVMQEGVKPLPHCDLCGVQIPAGWVIKYQRTKRCNRNMQIQWQRRDVVITSQCAEVSFSITG